MDERLLSDRSDEQPPPSHPEKKPLDTVAVLIGVAAVACVAMMLLCTAAYGLAYHLTSRRPAEYSVTIHGFAGLEDRVPRAFNFTIGVDNLGGVADVCVGGEAVVLYGGVPLAVGQVRELCVPRRRAADLDVVAESGGVGVPEALAELMAGEMRADGAVRVVMVRHGMMLSCTAPLGRGAPAQPYPCRVAGLADESDGIRPDDKSSNPS
ncbi:hypothetical protein EJB05_38739, partial [Eragrostis curvula]